MNFLSAFLCAVVISWALPNNFWSPPSAPDHHSNDVDFLPTKIIKSTLIFKKSLTQDEIFTEETEIFSPLDFVASISFHGEGTQLSKASLTPTLKNAFDSEVRFWTSAIPPPYLYLS